MGQLKGSQTNTNEPFCQKGRLHNLDKSKYNIFRQNTYIYLGNSLKMLQEHTNVKFLTYVEFGDVEDFPPADHVFPLHIKLKRIRPLSGWNELWA